MSGLDSTVINHCVLAEKILCDSYEKLITCINATDVGSWVKPTVHPYQKFDETLIRSEDDYDNLVNKVQRHSKCCSNYCWRQDQMGKQYFTFN